MCYCQPNVRTPFCNNCATKMFQDIQKLKEQRDELLDALKEIIAAADSKCWEVLDAGLDFARRAIAKATSK